MIKGLKAIGLVGWVAMVVIVVFTLTNMAFVGCGKKAEVAEEVKATIKIRVHQNVEDEADRKYSIEAENALLVDITSELSEVCGYNFVFSTMDSEKKELNLVTIDIEDVTLEEALIAITESAGLHYRFISEEIVLIGDEMILSNDVKIFSNADEYDEWASQFGTP